jgi:hypothetical protein
VTATAPVAPLITRRGSAVNSSSLNTWLAARPLASALSHQRQALFEDCSRDDRKLRALLKGGDDGTHVEPKRKTLSGWIDIWLKLRRPTLAVLTYERYSDLRRLQSSRNWATSACKVSLQRCSTSFTSPFGKKA